jgi:hypothetical protein
MSSAADELKAAGNAFFQAGDLEEAREKYTQALALEEKAVYFSNRAACFLLLGRYEAAVADVEAALAAGGMSPKLLGKTLVRGVTAALWAGNDVAREGFIATLEAHDAALAAKTTKKAAFAIHASAREHKEPASSASFDKLPKLRASFTDASEFYNVGHDSVATALQVGDTKLDVQLDADGVPYARVLMCGFGDARHVFHTIEDAPSDTKLHFSLVDINELVVARFVIMFDLLINVKRDDVGSLDLFTRAYSTNLLSVKDHERLVGLMQGFVEAKSCPHPVLGISDDTWASLQTIFRFWQDTGVTKAAIKDLNPQGMHESGMMGLDIESMVSSGQMPQLAPMVEEVRQAKASFVPMLERDMKTMARVPIPTDDPQKADALERQQNFIRFMLGRLKGMGVMAFKKFMDLMNIPGMSLPGLSKSGALVGHLDLEKDEGERV